MRYGIKNELTGLYWSNTMGWVDKLNATLFSEKEKNTLNLPIDGRWVLIVSSGPLDYYNA